MLPELLAQFAAVAHPIGPENRGDIAGILAGVASICGALVWPVLIGLFLWGFRDEVNELLKAAVAVAGGATRFKIWQIEFDRDVQQQVSRSETAAMVLPVVAPSGQAAAPHVALESTEAAATIPRTEVSAATGVRSLLESAPNSTLRKSAETAIHARMVAFAQEYETVRSSRHRGADRTRAMNGVVAKMRTLALAADLFLDEFMVSDLPGQRLAAICILQMKPEMRAVPWLAERMRIEQPFIFFHASVALLNTVRRFGPAQHDVLASALQSALTQVQSFGEKADANTIRLLTLAQSELEAGS